jgi:diguanylate cyclase (GGDEF)-like protein
MPADSSHPRQPRSSADAASASIVGRIERWRFLTTIAFATIGLALVGLIVANEQHFEPRVRHAIEAARVIRSSHEAMLNQESSLRGFLLSGDRRFLEPFEAGRDALATLNDSAESALDDGAEIRALYLELRLAQAAWIDGWTAQALSAGERQQASDALLLRGKELFDAYREANDAIAAELVARRTEAVDAQGRALTTVSLIALAITVALGITSFLRGRALRRALDPALEGVLAHLARIESGDLGAGAPLSGPRELEQIDVGIRRTASALALAQAQTRTHAERVEVQNAQLAEVLHVAREIAGSLNLRYVLRAVSVAASAIAGDQQVVVWLRAEDAPEVVAVADTAGPKFEPVGYAPVQLGEGSVGRAARFGRVEGHRGDLLDAVTKHADELAVPMVVGAEVIGVVQLCGEGVQDLPQDTLDVIEALAVQAATAISSARHHEQTETLAMTDALTHLPNRRRLEVDLVTEVGVSARYGRPLAFVMLDVDHFKAYNDEHGHQAADVALQELAVVLRQVLRTGDTAYRYGGEELAVMLRETDEVGGAESAERIRVAVEHHFSAPGQLRGVTVSLGVASMPKHASDAPGLVAAADAAMYDAKRAGRNRVCVAT